MYLYMEVANLGCIDFVNHKGVVPHPLGREQSALRGAPIHGA
jgi:hypothetical protein